MRRGDLIREIRREAKRNGLSFELIRSTGGHDVFSLDGLVIPLPRHREIGSGLTEDIRKQCEPKLGKGWWR